MKITGMTVSVEIADKSFGDGTSRFMSLSAKVNEGDAGIPLGDCGEALDTGIQMYMTAWETILQGRYADGGMKGPDFKARLGSALIRIQKIRTLYNKLKGMPLAELEGYMQAATEKANDKQS